MDLQDTVFCFSLDLFHVHGAGQGNRAREGTKAAFSQVVMTLFAFFTLIANFALDRQVIVRISDFDIYRAIRWLLTIVWFFHHVHGHAQLMVLISLFTGIMTYQAYAPSTVPAQHEGITSY